MSTVRDDICEIAAEIGRGSDKAETIKSPLYRRALVDVAHGAVGDLIWAACAADVRAGLIGWAIFVLVQVLNVRNGSSGRDVNVDFGTTMIGFVAGMTGSSWARALAPFGAALAGYAYRRTWG
ncbi:hypothetical protein DSD19_07975 [Rhodovulum sp. BSW8]|uniref:hypothetical protein n=1 Tax=Rhodovulum sp. BSW8 TaxID=2259645 RepID=UPI000DE3FA1C|nr:hypothetical protein [Rhodovulum sp. BSW8]RBO53738.1 hypothetical protein DSD19_07975 [Rhodovulum sp. BSW8]